MSYVNPARKADPGFPVPVVKVGHVTFAHKVREYERALHRLAAWDEGPVVSQGFDEACAAQTARETLASVGVAPPSPVLVFELTRNAGRKLTHVAEVDVDRRPVRVLCGRVKTSSLKHSSARDALLAKPTCPNCEWRLSCLPGAP